MRWSVYINRNKGKAVETSREVLDIPKTTKMDMAYACYKAAETFKVEQEVVLCIPMCYQSCTETDHTEECNKLFNAKINIITTER